MGPLETLRGALDSAQTELAQAEIALAEASARAETAREGQARLAAAVAALSGEPPPAAAPRRPDEDIISDLDRTTEPEAEPAKHSNPHARGEAAEMTPEEFDAERKRRQRQRKKEEEANNPYAQMKCSGCNQLGTMNEVIMQAQSGAPVRMMTCSSCGNQVL